MKTLLTSLCLNLAVLRGADWGLRRSL